MEERGKQQRKQGVPTVCAAGTCRAGAGNLILWLKGRRRK